MWCANCQADVAAEVSVDHRRIRCASCSSDLGESQVSRLSATTRNAREILERWSNSGLVDPFGPTQDLAAPADTMARGETPATPPVTSDRTTSDTVDASSDSERRASAPPSGRVEGSRPSQSEAQHGAGSYRIDTGSLPHSVSTTTPSHRNTNTVVDTRSVAESIPRETLRADAPVNSPPSPHFDVQHAIRPAEVKRDWGSAVGQWLAYLGVLVLTVGTCVVVYGHFGERPAYTPTGWLVMTFGQMLLFLGIISLVSGGIEQTSAEVARQVGELSEQLTRLENAARFSGSDVAFRGDPAHASPAGPHFSPTGSPAPHERHVVDRQTQK
ncbi:MAG: hypothetical protein O3A00_25310 [Planctomycetota bacterium]|nr:hypothetical protein [Planctomycetota bacterium]